MSQNQNTKGAGGKHGKSERIRLFPRKPFYIIAFIILALAAAGFLAMLIIADMLPSDLTIILAVSIFILLILTCLMFASKRRWKRIVGILFALIFVVMMTTVTSFMNSTHETLNKISSSSISATGPSSIDVSVTEQPFNIYITGIDQWESEKGYDLERSDVNMIVTVNPVTKKVLLTSIPRDSYVLLHTAQQMDKLTHTGVYGVDETINTVQDWLGIDLNYYVKMNFTAVVDIVEAMHGIRVYSPATFTSSLRDYHYVEGWNDLGGWKTLFFARERHAFEGQDSVRVENQQRVVEAIIKKMTSSTTLLTSYGDIMKAAGDNLSTNMSAEEMTELVKMQITDLAEWDVSTQKIEGEYDMDYVASLTQSQKFSIYKTDEESIRKCMQAIYDIQNPKVEELEEASENRSRSFVVNFINSVKEKALDKIDEIRGEE